MKFDWHPLSALQLLPADLPPQSVPHNHNPHSDKTISPGLSRDEQS